MCEAAPSSDAGLGPDGAAAPDAASPRCEAPGALALGAGIPTHLGGPIATVTDLDGDGRLELVSFSSEHPRQVGIGTWSGTGLDGPGRHLALPTLPANPLVGVDENGLPLFIGADRSTSIALRYAAPGYESIELRWFPTPDSSHWYPIQNGTGSISGHTFGPFFESRSLWGRDGVGGPIYRLVVESDHVRGEQVDEAAMFGDDVDGFGLLDGDVNADGVEDVLIFTRDSIWLGISGPGETWTRTARLAAEECYPSDTHRFGFVADLDLDGDRDVLLGVNCSTVRRGGFVAALRQDDGSYLLIRHELTGEAFRIEAAGLGDLDGDCYPDLLISDGRVARNDGTGRFLEPVMASDDAVGGMATLADLDFDGDLDVIWSRPRPDDASSPIVQLNMLR